VTFFADLAHLLHRFADTQQRAQRQRKEFKPSVVRFSANLPPQSPCSFMIPDLRILPVTEQTDLAVSRTGVWHHP
jgi:hypothetical protein